MPTPNLDPGAGIALITDGSANWKDRSGGWAWIALDAYDGQDRGAGHQADTTINQMELSAALYGLEWLSRHYHGCEVLVYSDSEYVVKGATDRTRARNANKKLWGRLQQAIGEHAYVEFIHVKGHAGHLWNEMVDQMAGEARLKGA